MELILLYPTMYEKHLTHTGLKYRGRFDLKNRTLPARLVAFAALYYAILHAVKYVLDINFL